MTLLAPAVLHVHRVHGGGLGTEVAHLILHAAVWRLMWGLPPAVVVVLAAAAGLFILAGKRRVSRER